LRGVALLLLALGIIEASVVGCGGISTPTTSRPPVTPTPGIGVPVKGGNWQITIVEASRTTIWKTFSAKSGNVLLVLDVTFVNLSTSQKTIILTGDAQLINQDGKMFIADAFEIKNSDIDNFLGTPIPSGTITGFSCFTRSCVYQAEIGVSGNSMSITLVYVLDASPSSSTNLKFQFQQVPPIPFSAT
jgi:hypothetical protein